MISRTAQALVVFTLLSAAFLAGCGGGSPVANVSPSQQIGSTPHLKLHGNVSSVHIWAAAPYENEIFGISAGARKALTVIDTDSQTVPATFPVSLKVDAAQNLWVANSNDQFTPGIVQEYVSGSFANAYVTSCRAYDCSYFSDNVTDVAATTNNVFAVMRNIQYDVYSGSSDQCYTGTGYEYWSIQNPSAAPNWFIFVGACPIAADRGRRDASRAADGDVLRSRHQNPNSFYGCTVCTLFSGDVDGAGNLWVIDDGASGWGLAEITNPASASASLTQIEPFGTYGTQAFVYVGDRGRVLNVEDLYHGVIFQYTLPVSPSATPFNTLNLPQCPSRYCGGSFAFSRNDKYVIVPSYCMFCYGPQPQTSLYIGTVKSGRWEQVTMPQFPQGWFQAAAYTPSDK